MVEGEWAEYVWVQQHDWVLEFKVPIGGLLEVMEAAKERVGVECSFSTLCLPAVRMLGYAVSAAALRFPVLRALMEDLRQEVDTEVGVGGSEREMGRLKVELTSMFFWHDKQHVACREHYLERVFPSRLAVLRVNFIGDKIGQRARGQMKEGLMGFLSL
jgi:hypothetical protein